MKSSAERVPADGEGHEERDREDRDDRLVAGLVGVLDLLPEILAQVVVAADPCAINEGLRGGVDPVLSLKGIDLLAGLQMVIFDRETLSFEQIL
ncbi:hypothetical protein ATO4_10854 [Aurantimonas sp. 22II-16-19i]|nr:hypothetical protein ATO4_10854 [Aurantimonas sp. 22II-16-19i]